MTHTKIDIAAPTRATLVQLLNTQLADGLDLMIMAKQAHWNVKGPDFLQLHELFDRINGETGEYVDLIAERAAHLAGSVEGTLRGAAKRSRLPDYPAEIFEGRAHLDAMSTALAHYAKSSRDAIRRASELDDADTADVLTEVSRGIDELLWLVEAHMQAEQ